VCNVDGEVAHFNDLWRIFIASHQISGCLRAAYFLTVRRPCVPNSAAPFSRTRLREVAAAICVVCLF
ncbi:MAG TPA: hypothetical protein VM912_08660, partial [Terriglobales bacterium]|nr:hypothetical protein [Terriglobales bacterium]